MSKEEIEEVLSSLLDSKLESLQTDLRQHTAELVDKTVQSRLYGGSSSSVSDNRETSDTRPNQGQDPIRPGGARGPGGVTLRRPSTVDTSDPAAVSGVDYQAEFAVIKDTLSRYKLPTDLKFTPNAVGIKREDKGAYNVVKSAAGYAEVNLKILSLIESGQYTVGDAVNDLATCNTALVRFLKEEHATLLVQGKFNKDTAFMFKALRKEGNSFTQESLDTLQVAANLTQYNHQAQDRPRGDYRGRFRGRGRGSYRGFGNFNSNNYNRDTYSRLSNQEVPDRRPNSDEN